MILDIGTIETRLQQLIDSAVSSEVAAQYQAAIKQKHAFIADKKHPIFFIGKVGIGKSSLIAIASNLLVDATPAKDKSSLRRNSVLATGGGRTTVCEVHISKSARAENSIVLSIEPVSLDDMQREIRVYAEDVWQRKNTLQKDSTYADIGGDGQEVQRFIRNMTGYADKQEDITVNGTRTRRTIRSFEEAALDFKEPEHFVAHMVMRAELAGRTQTEWILPAASDQTMADLKKLFDTLNQGEQAQALLPKKITISTADTLPGSDENFDVELIDTRSLDGGIESRGDLQECLRNPRALFVLCSSFNDAPNDSTRAILRAMANDVRFRSATARSVLLLVDIDNAASVNDAGGEREYGQMLKVDEAMQALRGSNLDSGLTVEQLIAFDVLQDDRTRLIQKLDQRLRQLHKNEENALALLLQEASDFIQHCHDALRPSLVAEIESSIKIVLSEKLPNVDTDGGLGSPLSDPMSGLYTAIEQSHPASRVFASCRRAGKFRNLDLYAATRAYASGEASLWIAALLTPVEQKLTELGTDPRYAIAKDVIYRYQRAFILMTSEVVNDYATAIGSEIETLLFVSSNDRDSPSARMWADCCAEWGKGDGFKTKVIGHLKSWARKQFFHAHESNTALEKIPFLKDVKPPEKAPEFTLRVANLRALKKVEWNPTEVCLLIGANGAGKTTLLKCLRLIRLAYETSLPDAVKTVFGGSHSLRNWFAKEGESIEICLQIDQASWSFELTPSEGTVDYRSNERFVFNGDELFSRNSLGELVFKGEAIEGNEKLGLRILIERGIKLPIFNKYTKFIKGISYFSDPDLTFFRKNGSYTEEDKEMNPNGGNALTMLRSWLQDLSNKHRYDFVIEGLLAAFPKHIKALDFKEAGKTLVARIYHPGQPSVPVPLEDEANGILHMLILLCALANAKPHSVIEIDEPENCLHPYAVRAFLRQAMTWARRHHVTVVLATHSIVLLDEFSKQPEKVFVMKEGENSLPLPTRLDQLYDRDWLDCFRLGDLFERDKLVSNEDGD